MRRTAWGLAVALPGLLWSGGPAAPQSTTPVVSASVGADSIGVGQPFELTLRVELASAADVRFPAVLPLPEDLEQRGPVVIESRDGGRSWEARYPIAGWKADSLAVPAIEAMVRPEGEQEFEISIPGPVVAVSSILPAEVADLELRDARPFLALRAFPWWILLVLAAVLAAAFVWWRRRAPAFQRHAPVGPGAIAISELDRLRGQWRGGELGLGQFYDAFESALRRYARATRNWSPSVGLAGLAPGGELLGALRRSTVVRFAHAGAPESGPDAAIDAGMAFVEAEIPVPEEESEDRSGGEGEG